MVVNVRSINVFTIELSEEEMRLIASAVWTASTEAGEDCSGPLAIMAERLDQVLDGY